MKAPLKDGTSFECDAEVVAWLLHRYPNHDVLACLREAVAWLEANPKRRKTERGMRRFLAAWCARTPPVRGNGSRMDVRPAAPPAREAHPAWWRLATEYSTKAAASACLTAEQRQAVLELPGQTDSYEICLHHWALWERLVAGELEQRAPALGKRLAGDAWVHASEVTRSMPATMRHRLTGKIARHQYRCTLLAHYRIATPWREE